MLASADFSPSIRNTNGLVSIVPFSRLRLTFEVHAKDSKGVIGEGMHVRYIVDREKFMSKLS